MSTPVSIVVPTYNRLRVLRETIHSYLDQPRMGEVVVVDDGGGDGTFAWLSALAREHPSLKPVRVEPNGGSPEARNRGIREAAGDWILCVDDDVILDPLYASVLLAHAEEGGFQVMAGRRLWLRPGETPPVAERRLAGESRAPAVNTRLLQVNDCARGDRDLALPLVQAVMLVHRDVFRAVRYDPRYAVNAWREESDFQLSALEKGFRIGFCPHTACYHTPKELAGGGGGQRSASRLRYEWNLLRNNRRFLEKHRAFLSGVTPEAVNGPLWWLVLRAYVQGRLLDKARRVLGDAA